MLVLVVGWGPHVGEECRHCISVGIGVVGDLMCLVLMAHMAVVVVGLAGEEHRQRNVVGKAQPADWMGWWLSMDLLVNIRMSYMLTEVAGQMETRNLSYLALRGLRKCFAAGDPFEAALHIEQEAVN